MSTQKPAPKTRICKTCLKTLPLDPYHFYPVGKSFQKNCTICHNKRCTKNALQRRTAQKEKELSLQEGLLVGKERRCLTCHSVYALDKKYFPLVIKGRLSPHCVYCHAKSSLSPLTLEKQGGVSIGEINFINNEGPLEMRNGIRGRQCQMEDGTILWKPYVMSDEDAERFGSYPDGALIPTDPAGEVAF